MNTPTLASRVLIGAGAVALTGAMTSCGGTKTPAGDSSNPSSSNASSSKLTCQDPMNDVIAPKAKTKVKTKLKRKPKAPAWNDLTSVSWDHEDDGATVVFTTRGALVGKPDVMYATSIVQGTASTLVIARYKKGLWQVTSGVRSPVLLRGVRPLVTGTTITLALPEELPADSQQIDLEDDSNVGAEVYGKVLQGGRLTIYRDRYCSQNPSAAAGTGNMLHWPGVDDDDGKKKKGKVKIKVPKRKKKR